MKNHISSSAMKRIFAAVLSSVVITTTVPSDIYAEESTVSHVEAAESSVAASVNTSVSEPSGFAVGQSASAGTQTSSSSVSSASENSPAGGNNEKASSDNTGTNNSSGDSGENSSAIDNSGSSSALSGSAALSEGTGAQDAEVISGNSDATSAAGTASSEAVSEAASIEPQEKPDSSEAVTSITITIASGEGGTIKASAEALPDYISVSEDGKTVTETLTSAEDYISVDAAPSDGYKFSGWQNADGTICSQNETLEADSVDLTVSGSYLAVFTPAEELDDTTGEDTNAIAALQELSALDAGSVGAVSWSSSLRRMKRVRRIQRSTGDEESEPEQPATIDPSSWSFDLYYMNEEDDYDITKTGNGNLKYQIEFRNDTVIPEGAVNITIPRAFFSKRDGTPVFPTASDIAVPSSKSSFSYKIDNGPDGEADTADDLLVFTNEKELPSGHGEAWQVLFRGIHAVDIKDGTEWAQTATASVTNCESKKTGTLKGRFDTSVHFSGVSKTAFSSSGKKYTPGLYTLAQLKSYASAVTQFGKEVINGSKSFDDYYYVVWKIDLSGSGTQPFYLTLQDTTVGRTSSDAAQSYPGEIVGFSGYRGSVDYKDVIRTIKGGDGNALTVYRSADSDEVLFHDNDDTKCSSENWNTSFFVVTAYKKSDYKDQETDETGNTSSGSLLPYVENTLTAVEHPYDALDEDQSYTKTADYQYRVYDWVYEGDGIRVDKYTDTSTFNRKDNSMNHKTERKLGWFEVLRNSLKNGKDLDGLNFYVDGFCHGYSITHKIKDSDGTLLPDAGTYIPGSYYTMTTYDDVVYADLQDVDGNTIEGLSKWKRLTGEDYYYSKVTIERSDVGYDVFEDKTAEPDQNTGVNQDIRVYAMFADKLDKNNPDSQDQWELVGNIPWNSTGKNMTYTFTDAQIARKPWRIKVEYNSTNYASHCYMYLTMALRGDTDGYLKTEISSHEDTAGLQLENLAGISGVACPDGKPEKDDNGNIVYFSNRTGKDFNYDQYSDSDLEKFTKDSYGTLLMRENAYKMLTGVDKDAASYKTVRTSNDTTNGRVKVTYNLTAYHGYIVDSKETLSTLRSIGGSGIRDLNVGREGVVFYDLLPLGVKYDGSVKVLAGRITNISEDGFKSYPNAWNRSNVSVTINDSDIIDNWRGTGRTMLCFHVKYMGDDPSCFSYDNNQAGHYLEGYGVSFGAYYSWDTIRESQKDNNICAFMPENTSEELTGKTTQVAFDDGKDAGGTILGSVNVTKAYDAFRDGNLDGDAGNDSSIRRVLYADVSMAEDYATAGSSGVVKKVRADSDIFGTYNDSAIVQNGETYTYDITIEQHGRNAGADPIIFDVLEDSWDAYQNGTNFDNYKFLTTKGHNVWYGTLKSVSTGEAEEFLKDDKAHLVVWVNTKTRKTVRRQIKNVDPTAKVLTSDNGWIRLDSSTDLSKVTALAFQIVSDSSANNFTMKDGDSLSFRIQMQVPAEIGDTTSAYTYNHAVVLYQKSSNQSGSISQSDPVRVKISNASKLIVEKETEGEVPSGAKDTDFTFTALRRITTTDTDNTNDSDNGESTETNKFADQKYSLEMKSGDEWVKADSVVHTTSASGEFKLRAGQRAVFADVEDADQIEISEQESVLWEATEKDPVVDDGARTRTLTFINRYRAPLYITKQVLNVPDDYKTAHMDYSKERYTPMPEDSSESSDSGYGQAVMGKSDSGEITSETFTMKIEKSLDNQTWEPLSCGKFMYVSSIRTNGASPAVDKSKGVDGYGMTDKDGYVTLYPEDIIAVFVGGTGTYYRISEMLHTDKTEETTDWAPKLIYSSQDHKLDVNGSYVKVQNRYRWKDLLIHKDITYQEPEDCTEKFTFIVKDADGNPLSGLSWELLDGEAEDPVLGENDKPITGTTGEDGRVTAACAGKVIRVRHIASGTKLTVSEDTTNMSSYYRLKGNNERTLTMPTESLNTSTTFVNECLLRDISVKKTVAYDPSSSSERNKVQRATFYMDITGRDIDNLETGTKIRYIVTAASGGNAGKDTIRHAQVEEKDSEVSNGSSKYLRIALKDGESALVRNIGLADSDVTVTEEKNSDFKQIVPLDEKPNVVTLKDDNSASCEFINGDKGALVIMKEYVGKGQYCDEVRSRSTTARYMASSAIHVTVNGEEWPNKTLTNIKAIDTKYGTTTNATWVAHQPLSALPSNIYIIPESDLEDIRESEITISEDPYNQHQLINWGGDNEIRQIYPANDGSYRGKPEEIAVAKFINNISNLGKVSTIYKMMTMDSDEVSNGQRLTLRVERYNGWNWEPAAGISYYLKLGDEAFASDRVETTSPDGLIRITKQQGPTPYIVFTNDKVVCNPSSPAVGTLRIMEVPEQTDPDWGTCIGYSSSTSNYQDNGKVRADYQNGDTIWDSNQEQTFRIEKKTENTTNTKFSFTIQKATGISEESGVRKATAVDSAAGIQYDVYDGQSGDPLSCENVIGQDGKFTLQSGQYAEFTVPEGSYWKVSENFNSGYHLRSLDVTENQSEMNSYKEGDSETDNTVLVGRDVEEYTCDTIKESDLNSSWYTVDGTEISFNGTVVLPEYVRLGGPREPITQIRGIEGSANSQSYSFPKSNVTSLTLPDSVVFIGMRAFQNASFNELNVGNSLYVIETNAFGENNQLTFIHLPASLRDVRSSIFCNNNNIQKIEIDQDNPVLANSSGRKIIYNKITNVMLEGTHDVGSDVPEFIAGVKNYAMQFSKMTLTLPASVNWVASGAFYGSTGTLEIKRRGENLQMFGADYWHPGNMYSSVKYSGQ